MRMLMRARKVSCQSATPVAIVLYNAHQLIQYYVILQLKIVSNQVQYHVVK